MPTWSEVGECSSEVTRQEGQICAQTVTNILTQHEQKGTDCAHPRTHVIETIGGAGVTGERQGILSPLRLPVPPSRLRWQVTDIKA
jgi:hypothetical protein